MNISNIILLLVLAIATIELVESIYTPEDATGSNGLTIFNSVSEFKERTQNDDGVWMVQFYSPSCGHCQEFKPMFMTLAEGFKGIVSVGVVDASQGIGQELANEFKVESFPTIKIFGVDRKNPTTYDGQREVGNIVQTVMNDVVQVLSSRIPGLKADPHNGSKQKKQKQKQQHDTGAGDSKAVELTAANIESKLYSSSDVWLVAFIAPWCGHCKSLLPEWKMAADQLAGQGVQLGLVDVTVEESLGSDYNVKGFPTIKMFPGGAGKSTATATDYQGGRTADEIIKEALKEADKSPPLPISQLTSQKIFDDTCTSAGKSTVCVLIALPHIIETSAEKRNANIETIQTLAKSFRGSPFRFVWFEGASQIQLEQKIEMSFGFPAVIALNVDKSIYCIHRFSFNEKALSTFLYSITSGRATSYKLRDAQLSNIIVDAEAWDGKDGEVFEEEDDLADIMGDDWNTDL